MLHVSAQVLKSFRFKFKFYFCTIKNNKKQFNYFLSSAHPNCFLPMREVDRLKCLQKRCCFDFAKTKGHIYYFDAASRFSRTICCCACQGLINLVTGPLPTVSCVCRHAIFHYVKYIFTFHICEHLQNWKTGATLNSKIDHALPETTTHTDESNLEHWNEKEGYNCCRLTSIVDNLESWFKMGANRTKTRLLLPPFYDFDKAKMATPSLPKKHRHTNTGVWWSTQLAIIKMID